LIYLYYYPKQTLFGRQKRLNGMMTALHTIWWPNVLLATSQHWTSSRLIRGCSVGRTREDGLSRLIYLYYYPKHSIIGHQQRLRRILTALHTIWWPNVLLATSQNWTSSRLIRGCSNGPTREDGLSRLIYLFYYPKQRIFGRQQRLRRMLTALLTILWPNVVLAASPNWTSS
jgi:hypothetical protein